MNTTELSVFIYILVSLLAGSIVMMLGTARAKNKIIANLIEQNIKRLLDSIKEVESLRKMCQELSAKNAELAAQNNGYLLYHEAAAQKIKNLEDQITTNDKDFYRMFDEYKILENEKNKILKHISDLAQNRFEVMSDNFLVEKVREYRKSLRVPVAHVSN